MSVLTVVNVKGSSVCMHSFLPPRLRRFRERKKDVKIIQMRPPSLINHSFTNTITVTDNVMGERNRKI